jgi:iron complex transport system substrate-binding protein
MRGKATKRTIVVLITALLAFGASALANRALHAPDPSVRQQTASGTDGRRIVSMAPSITETLFALGLGERVAAVTRYCEYPAEAKEKPRIGGFYDANYEALLALAPDLAILLPEQEKVRQFLDKQGIPVLIVNNKTISDLFAMIGTIAGRCGLEAQGQALTAELIAKREAIRQEARRLARSPRVLVSIGGNMGSGPEARICVAGPGTFYGQLVALVGGRNAYQGRQAFPEISREGLLELNPEVIIDIAVNTDYRRLEAAAKRAMLAKWREAAAGTAAVRDGRISILEGDYLVIPGPRFIQALEDVAAVIGPRGETGTGGIAGP